MFSQACVKNSVHGVCAWQGGMHGGQVWQGACMAGVCIAGCVCAGGHAWQGGMLGRGMHGRGHAWQRGYVWRGHTWQERWPLQCMVHILLECIIVSHAVRPRNLPPTWKFRLPGEELLCLALIIFKGVSFSSLAVKSRFYCIHFYFRFHMTLLLVTRFN